MLKYEKLFSPILQSGTAGTSHPSDMQRYERTSSNLIAMGSNNCGCGSSLPVSLNLEMLRQVEHSVANPLQTFLPALAVTAGTVLFAAGPSVAASRVVPSTWPGTTVPFTAVFDIENETPDRGTAFGGQLYVTLLTEDPESSDPSLITGFGPESYWQSNEPGALPESVTLLPTGTLFGNAGPGYPPTGPTNNLWFSTQPQVDGKGFAFYYGNAIVPQESYQIFSKPSDDPRGFSYYGCWGEGECVNVKQLPVPGPLPLLGVGAAFGFSRKLRKRIKTNNSPEVMSAIG